MLNPLEQLFKRHGSAVFRIAGSAHRHEHIGVVGENGGFLRQMERVDKPLPQSFKEEQRSAEKQHLALDLPSLSQTGNGLIDHRLKDARGDILLARALIEQRLDIGLGKYAAAGRNGVQLLVPQTQLIELIGRDPKQGGHLVDKSAGSAGTGTVHPLLETAGEENNLGILAAELHHHVGIGNKALHRPGCGIHLLDKRDARGVGYPQPRGAGDRHLYRLSLQSVG